MLSARCLLAAFLLAVPPSLAMPPAALAQTGESERYNVLAAADVPANARLIGIDIPRDKGRVKALRIAALSGDVTVTRALVIYRNGQVHFEDHGRSFRVPGGAQSDDIDRRDEQRFVERVEIALEPSRQAARIEIRGLQIGDGVTRGLERPKTRGAAPPATDTGRTRGAASASTHCQDGVCAEVLVLYGTDRRCESIAGGKRAACGVQPAGALTLGSAVVSIPVQHRVAGKWSRPEFLDRWIWRREEDKSRDFVLHHVETLSLARFKQLAETERRRKGTDRVLVFVHGFNVGFDDALYRTAQIAHDAGFTGVPMAFSWPSKGSLRDYTADNRVAPLAARWLQEFIEIAGAGAAEVHLVAHSLGNNPLLTALERLRSANRSNLRIGQVVMAAPDMLRPHFASIVPIVRPMVRGMTLYASDNDRALPWSLDGLPVGLIRGDPFVVAGVQLIDVSQLNKDVFDTNHATYASHKELLADIAALLAGGTAMPHERNGAFKRLPAPNLAGEFFWRHNR